MGKVNFELRILPERAIATLSTPPNGANASRAFGPNNFSK